MILMQQRARSEAETAFHVSSPVFGGGLRRGLRAIEDRAAPSLALPHKAGEGTLIPALTSMPNATTIR
jgi:hypothetical protein